MGVFMKLNEFTIGQVFETKSSKLTKEDITRFAGEFDPQYMHLVCTSYTNKSSLFNKRSKVSPIIAINQKRYRPLV